MKALLVLSHIKLHPIKIMDSAKKLQIQNILLKAKNLEKLVRAKGCVRSVDMLALKKFRRSLELAVQEREILSKAVFLAPKIPTYTQWLERQSKSLIRTKNRSLKNNTSRFVAAKTSTRTRWEPGERSRQEREKPNPRQYNQLSIWRMGVPCHYCFGRSVVNRRICSICKGTGVTKPFK